MPASVIRFEEASENAEGLDFAVTLLEFLLRLRGFDGDSGFLL
jgi:hypothetical protein